MSGGGDVIGIIISKSFNHNSGESVKYGEPFVLDGPISPAVLNSENGTSEESYGKGPIISFTSLCELNE